MAYGRKGDLAQADLAAAQAAFTRGDVTTARQLAARAKTRLPVGSPAWVRADDIVSVKPPTAAKQMTTARTKPMTSSPRIIAAVCAALLAIAAPQAVRAQNFSPAQRGEIERVVHDYLIAHPEVLQEAMSRTGEAPDRRAKPRSTRPRSRSTRRSCSPRPTRSRSAIRTATSPSSSSSITIAATASAPWTTCSRCSRTIPSSRSCSRNSRCSGRARWKPRTSPSPCACRTRPARNISNSTPSCSAAAVRPTRRTRSPSPRTSAWTWPSSKRT